MEFGKGWIQVFGASLLVQRANGRVEQSTFIYPDRGKLSCLSASINTDTEHTQRHKTHIIAQCRKRIAHTCNCNAFARNGFPSLLTVVCLCHVSGRGPRGEGHGEGWRPGPLPGQAHGHQTGHQRSHHRSPSWPGRCCDFNAFVECLFVVFISEIVAHLYCVFISVCASVDICHQSMLYSILFVVLNHFYFFQITMW